RRGDRARAGAADRSEAKRLLQLQDSRRVDDAAGDAALHHQIALALRRIVELELRTTCRASSAGLSHEHLRAPQRSAASIFHDAIRPYAKGEPVNRSGTDAAAPCKRQSGHDRTRPERSA